MGNSLLSEVGIGQETTYGTAVASSRYLSMASVNITQDRQRLREDFQFGVAGTPQADNGRLRITGNIDGIHARADLLGDLLRGVLGDPVDAGSDPYTHTYTDALAKFSTAAALPPYTVNVHYNTRIHAYDGGQLTTLTLSQARDQRLLINTGWIFKGVADISSESPTLESNTPFKFSQLTVQRNSVTFTYFEDLTITISAPLETEELLDASDEVTCTERSGPVRVEVSGTVSSKDTTLYTDFTTPTVEDWTFTWSDGTDSLAITLDRLNIEAFGEPINGAGRQTFSVTGVAEYDTSNSRSIQAVLTNSIASY